MSSVYGTVWVLCYALRNGGNDVTIGKYVKLTKPYWLEVYTGDEICVTNWMPLPEPPIKFDQDTMLMSKYEKGDYNVD